MSSSGVHGDLAGLMRQVRSLKTLHDKTKRALANEALSLVALGFHESKDPYGEPWAPLVLREGKPLRDTGRLGSSFATQVTTEGFRIGTKVRYAPTHQYGATITPKQAKALRFAVGRGKGKRWFTRMKVVIPARRMIPRPGSLGAVWARAFQRILRQELAKVRAAAP